MVALEHDAASGYRGRSACCPRPRVRRRASPRCWRSYPSVTRDHGLEQAQPPVFAADVPPAGGGGALLRGGARPLLRVRDRRRRLPRRRRADSYIAPTRPPRRARPRCGGCTTTTTRRTSASAASRRCSRARAAGCGSPRRAASSRSARPVGAGCRTTSSAPPTASRWLYDLADQYPQLERMYLYQWRGSLTATASTRGCSATTARRGRRTASSRVGSARGAGRRRCGPRGERPGGTAPRAPARPAAGVALAAPGGRATLRTGRTLAPAAGGRLRVRARCIMRGSGVGRCRRRLVVRVGGAVVARLQWTSPPGACSSGSSGWRRGLDATSCARAGRASGLQTSRQGGRPARRAAALRCRDVGGAGGLVVRPRAECRAGLGAFAA